MPAGRTRMHAGEVLTEPALVRALLLDQFPALAELPLELVPSFGTDHDVYRVGSELSARLPRIGWALRQAETEAAWMPRFAPHLPVAVPEVVSTGVPGHGYPFAWSLHRWLPGEAATTASFDRDDAALDLARCIHALQAIPTTGAHPRLPGARGGPLLEADAGVRDAAARLDPTRDEGMEEAEVVAAWDRSLAVPAYQGRGVWVHGDLLPGNLLLIGKRLSAVIDWGGLNVGDPACDLQPAWHVFEGSSPTASGRR